MLRCRVGWLALGLCLAMALPVLAESPKPLVILSMSGYEASECDPEAVGFVGEAPEMPVWLESMFRLYANGRDSQGLDDSRPWGAVIQHGSGLSAYGFVPVKDAETLSWELSEYIQSQTEVGDGIYQVVGTEPGKMLYAKVTDKWIFASDCAETLESTPADPAKLLDGMNKQYDVAVRVVLKNIPSDAGEEILAKLDETLGPTLRGLSCDKTVEILGKMAVALDEVTFGWSKR